jgi:hypothetical protein
MWVPFALKKPVKKDPGDGLRIKKRALIIHTAVTDASSLYHYWYDHPLETHFYINKAGVLEQYVDTDIECDHAFDANPWAMGVETWDGRDPERNPLNQAQLATIDRLAHYLKIPAQWLKEYPSDGIGYHRQYDSWNKSNHSCPGNLRLKQFAGIIERLGEEEMDQATFNAYLREAFKVHPDNFEKMADAALTLAEVVEGDNTPSPKDFRAKVFAWLKLLASGKAHDHKVEVVGEMLGKTTDNGG